MTAPHLPPDVPLPPQPVAVVPLDVDLGESAGHRLRLLSLELWRGWADLRFARIDGGTGRRLTRRVPPADAWSATADGRPLQVLDAVGRGDRSFSNGEVRLRPPPRPGQQLTITVTVVPGSEPLTAQVRVPEPPVAATDD